MGGGCIYPWESWAWSQQHGSDPGTIRNGDFGELLKDLTPHSKPNAVYPDFQKNHTDAFSLVLKLKVKGFVLWYLIRIFMVQHVTKVEYAQSAHTWWIVYTALLALQISLSNKDASVRGLNG